MLDYAVAKEWWVMMMQNRYRCRCVHTFLASMFAQYNFRCSPSNAMPLYVDVKIKQCITAEQHKLPLSCPAAVSAIRCRAVVSVDHRSSGIANKARRGRAGRREGKVLLYNNSL